MLRFIYENVGDMQAFVISVTLFLLAYSYWSKEPWLKIPPGPFCFPFIGSTALLSADIREPLRNMGATYGDVFTVYFGDKRCIVLHSVDAIKEGFDKLGIAFCGRPTIPFVQKHTKGLGEYQALCPCCHLIGL